MPGAGPRFDDIFRVVRAAGLMDSRPGYFMAKIALNAVMYGAGWAAFAVLGDSWWQLLTAVWMAFCFSQSGFVGHDAGHRQIFRSRRGVDVVGIIHGNVLAGISFGWWVGHHNRHHSYPNHLELDPDILRRQVIFHAKQRAGRPGRASAFIIRHQSWMFFVLILMEGLRLHLAGYVAAAKGVLKRLKRLELTLVTLHLIAYFAAVFLVLSPVKAVPFVLIHQGLFGLYMGMVFAPNHKGLPVRDGAEELDWLERQVVTSRNLVSTRFIDFLYGGLNYQIEHHLFPAMPRVNLRKARPLVRDFCLRNGIPYAETGVWASYRAVSRHLASVTAETRGLEAAAR